LVIVVVNKDEEKYKYNDNDGMDVERNLEEGRGWVVQ